MLVISYNDLDAEGAKSIGKLAALKSLHIATMTGLPEGFMKHLAAAPRLEFIEFSGSRVRDADIKDLVGIRQLTGLDLYQSLVTDEAVASLVQIKTLTYLNLLSTKITPAGIKRLRQELPRCRVSYLTKKSQ